MKVANGMNRESAAMLKLCVLATTLVAVICAPLEKHVEDPSHVIVKRAGGEEPVIESDERSLSGYQPEDEKQAEKDQSAVVNTEVLPAEDPSSGPDVVSNSKQQSEEFVPMQPDQLGDSQTDDATEEGSEEPQEESEDLTESEEEDLKKLTSAQGNDIAADSAESTEMSDEDKTAEIPSSLLPSGRYSKLLYDLYNPYDYARRRRAAPRPAAATAEDMTMGGGGMGGGGGEEVVQADGLRTARLGGRRIKRDLNMDELRSLLKRGGGGYVDDYSDYPEYEDYPEYTDNEPLYYDDNQVDNIPEGELLAEELAQEGYDYPKEYTDYPDYEEALEDYYEEPNQVYPEEVYPDYEQGYYPEQGIDDMSLQQKLALMGYLEREELPEEGYEPYGEYPGVEETYEDLGPASQEVYKRQYLSFVPGVKRSSDREFYPISGDGWWRGITDPMAEEQKRNDMEYERLLRLAAALNGPDEDEEWKKK